MKKFTAFLSLLLMFAVSGCGQKAQTRTVEGDVTGQGVSIDTEETDSDSSITVSVSMAKTLNPLVNSDESVDMALSLLYEKLIVIGPDGKAEPNIAQSWTFNEDGSVAYINLRNDVCFSDGTRLTAYDVAYSLKTIDNADNSYYENCVENIKTWTVTGDYSLSVTFYDTGAGNIFNLAIPVISRVFYGGDYADGDINTDTALGTGYYRFESFKKPDNLSLVASLNCFKGMAEIDRVNIIMTKDQETNYNLFAQGITDILAAGNNAADAVSRPGVNSVSYRTNEYDFIGFNFNNSILSDRNVRQAIAYSIDKDSMIEAIYLGDAEEAYSPVSSSSWLYDSSVYGYDYDPSVARMLLEQSGWRFRSGSDGVRQSGGDSPRMLSLSILVNGENNERRQVAVKLAEALEGIGFDIILETVNFDTYSQRLENGNFDIFVGTWSLSPIGDYTFMFGSQELNGEDWNIINYSSAKMDEYLTACSEAASDEDMISAYSNLQKYISQELPYVSLVFRKSRVYTGPRIDGSLTPALYNVLSGVEGLKIKE